MNEQSNAEIIAGHEVTRGPRGVYLVKTLDGLRTIGEFSRRTQAEQAAHLAAAYAAAEQRRIDEQRSANG
jgi:hypothetical protein